jgi:hypothetical protein
VEKVNSAKVLLGGVVAGIVLNGFDYFSNKYVTADAWQVVVQSRNIDPALMMGQSALIMGIVADMLLGLLLVWTYAAMRPRFGPGAGTAMASTMTIFLSITTVLSTFGGWFIPWDLFMKQAGISFVAFIAAGLAGGYLYTEGSPDDGN